MPMADGMIYLAPHPGQGRLLMGCIDPSVTDEGDALSIDDALNPFNPENGYSREPGATRYSAEFVSRYRNAQRERVARLDRIARQLIGKVTRQDCIALIGLALTGNIVYYVLLSAAVQRVGIAPGNEDACEPVLHDIRHSPDPGGHDRCVVGHALEYEQGRALAIG